MDTKLCIACKYSDVHLLLNFGIQPISNRFLLKPQDDQFHHPLILGVCRYCGLIQLINPVSSQEVRPHFDWIRYREPEQHLDTVVQTLCQLPNVSTETQILGVSGHEFAVFERLRGKGFSSFEQLCIQQDLNVYDPYTGLETIQESLTLDRARTIARQRSPVDLVYARYILEHAHHPIQFLQALQIMTKPGGYIVIEVPDFTKPLERCDYSTIWEEHTCYFTPHSFKNMLTLAGLELLLLDIYPYSLENSMVAIARVSEKRTDGFELNKQVGESINTEIQRALNYAEQYEGQCKKYAEQLERLSLRGQIALFGAGHIACHFINLMKVGRFIQLMVDDHPNKKGLFMPGSCLPILSTTALSRKKIKTCLLSVNSDHEETILRGQLTFTAAGGEFYSIFSNSPRSLLNMGVP